MENVVENIIWSIQSKEKTKIQIQGFYVVIS